MPQSPPCPLCHQHVSQAYLTDKRRDYWQCDHCQLVFVEPSQLPAADREKAEYDLHENSLLDAGYRAFLERLALPLQSKLTGASSGLDFGCGMAPLLAKILTDVGHTMHLYDPIYVNDQDALKQSYDFICCSEAIEHFHHPANEWHTWMKLLKPGGWLGIMTKRVISKDKFAHWHYKNDITHVSFFSEYTFNWLAMNYNLSVEFPSADVVLMQKLS